MLTKSFFFLQKIYLLSSFIYIGQLFIFWIEILFTKIIETTNLWCHKVIPDGLKKKHSSQNIMDLETCTSGIFTK